MDKTIILWDFKTKQKIGSALTGHTSWIWRVRFSSDGKRIVSSSWDNTLRIWDVDSQSLIKQLDGHTAMVREGLFLSNDKVIVSASEDGTIRLWDTKTFKQIGGTIKPHNSKIYALCLNPNQQQLASSSLMEMTIKQWNIPKLIY